MQFFLSDVLHDANDANDLNYKQGLLQKFIYNSSK
jgi:hypothetical protein